MDTQTRASLVVSTVKATEEKQLHYRQIIIQVLKQHARAPINGDIQTISILDTVGDHYQLLDMGWDDAGQRIFQPIIHVDLQGTKAWIQENTTDLDIAKVLVTSGIQPSDIVLGLHSRALRQFSEYAVE